MGGGQNRWEQKRQLTKMIAHAKKEFYKERLSKANHDQKEIFRCVNELLNKSRSSTLPSHSSKSQLADDMSDFFMEKMNRIRQSLEEIQHGATSKFEDPISSTFLSVLEYTSCNMIIRKTVIFSMKRENIFTI